MAKRILVADDSVTIQRAFVMTFAAEDVTITPARSADEGLALARQSAPDLVIADAVMPGRSGYDLCAALKADGALAAIPVFILCSSQNPYDEARGRQVGALGHLLKPFESGSLIDRVHEALRKSEASAPAFVRRTPSPAMGIPVPSADATYDEDDYGEISIEASPSRELPRPSAPAPTASPAPASAFLTPAPAVSASLLTGPAVRPPSANVTAPGLGPGAMPAPGLAPGPGLRPSLIPGVRPGLTPNSRPGVVPAPTQTPTRQGAPGPGAHGGPVAPTGLPAGLNPTPLRPASVPTARTMVGMPRPGLSLPVPTPPARPGTGPVRPLAAHTTGAAPAAPAPAGGPVGLVDRKVAEIAARGPEYEILAKLSREVIEKIVWEIVPELTEAIVREELHKRRA